MMLVRYHVPVQCVGPHNVDNSQVFCPSVCVIRGGNCCCSMCFVRVLFLLLYVVPAVLDAPFREEYAACRGTIHFLRVVHRTSCGSRTPEGVARV